MILSCLMCRQISLQCAHVAKKKWILQKKKHKKSWKHKILFLVIIFSLFLACSTSHLCWKGWHLPSFLLSNFILENKGYCWRCKEAQRVLPPQFSHYVNTMEIKTIGYACTGYHSLMKWVSGCLIVDTPQPSPFQSLQLCSEWCVLFGKVRSVANER